jgi:uncharacterized protein (TIGR02246 family)
MITTPGRWTNAFVILVATVLGAASPSVGQDSKPTDRAADRSQIAELLKNVEEAWNTHDMARFASLFHEDGIWVLWTGDVWSGRRAIEEGHAAVHETFFRSSVQLEHLEELRFVGPDAAVLRYCSVLKGDTRAPETLIRSRKIMVITRRDGAWRIGWGQNSRLRDSTPDSECFAVLRKSAEGVKTAMR